VAAALWACGGGSGGGGSGGTSDGGGASNRGFWAAPAVAGDVLYLAAPDGTMDTMTAPSVGRGLILWSQVDVRAGTARVTALAAPKYRP
jgi:hypothetical protein